MKSTKTLNYKSISLVVILAIMYSILGNMSFKVFSKQLWWISDATHGIVQGTLVINLIAIILFSIAIFGFFKLKCCDFYLSKKSIINGIKAIVILWALVQIIILIMALVNSEAIVWHKFTLTETGSFIAQLFGNAPYEEFIFRGFLVVQLFVIFKNKLSNKKALILSVIISQLIFALVHIPNRIIIESDQNLIIDSLKIFLGGIIGALIFIRTKNLVYLVGFHALANIPFKIVNTSASSELLILVLGIIIAVFWSKIFSSRLFESSLFADV